MSHPSHETDQETSAAGPPRDLAALEVAVAALRAEAETLEPAELGPRLAALEGELLAYACASPDLDAATAGHPAVDVVLGWEERLRRAEEAAAAREVATIGAERMIRDLRAKERPALEVEARIAAGESPWEGAEAQLFEQLMDVEELRRRVEGRAERIGPAAEADARLVCDEALSVQRRLRGALEVAVEHRRRGDGIPRLTRRAWADRLVDLADEALLEAPESEPQRAYRFLIEVRRALQWHLEHVEDEGRRGTTWRRLTRRIKRLRAEEVELRLAHRLTRTFGARFVRLWERAVIVAILGVVVLLLWSLVQGHSRTLMWIDTAICAFLIVDFFGKASFIGFHPSWLKRHVWTDLLPALPFAWIASLDGGSAVAGGQAGRGVVGIRLVKVARSLRLALPLIRMARALSFLLRGLDRLVQRSGAALETRVLLFPSPEERRRRARVAAEGPTELERYWRLRGDMDGLYEAALERTPDGDGRAALCAPRAEAFRAATRTPVCEGEAPAVDRAARRLDEAPMATDMLRHLTDIGSEEVEGRFGTEAVRRISRAARLVASSPLRWVPVLGGWAPADASDLPDRRAASRTVRRVARTLETAYDRVLWWADLRGVLTPGELVGRVGATLVARTSRPAIRLLMFGTAYVVLLGALALMGIEPKDPDKFPDVGVLGSLVFTLKRIIAGGFLILGSICFVFLGIGVWLQRLAKNTTTFHEQVARAQFLHLTDSIKSRMAGPDAELLEERVFMLERSLFEADGAKEAAERDRARFLRNLEAFQARGVSPPSNHSGFDPVARSVMLYRDLLDGALLAHSDTRVTSQLLGNLAIQRVVNEAARVPRTQRKALRRLDLERRNTLVRGPYIWFHAIGRALSSRAARLIVDYNAHAIPLRELPRISDEERARYEAWLARQSAQTGAPDGGDEDAAEEATSGRALQLTTAFTVLHFLDASPARDAEVAARFGDDVLVRLQEDRRRLVRRVFGTYPLHHRPRESRLVSVRQVYDEWVGGGRILVLPLRATWVGLRLTLRGFGALHRAVLAIREPARGLYEEAGVEADLDAALRKIDRMRAPAALQAARLRATIDPEYHGLGLPFGLFDPEELLPASGTSAARRDAEFLGARAVFTDELAALEHRATRAIGHLERAAREGLVERLGERLGTDLTEDPETLRALSILVVSDEEGLRSDLFGAEVFAECVIDGLEFGLPRGPLIPPLALWPAFRGYWRAGGREALVSAARKAGVLDTESGSARRVKRAAWRALCADADGARRAFRALREARELGPEAARRRAEERLADALRHPTRVTEQLVTVRIVQTMTLMDVRNYREHVRTVGEYPDPTAGARD